MKKATIPSTELSFLRVFDYDSSNKDIQKIFSKVLRENKVVHIKGIPPNTDLNKFYSDLALASGNVVKRNEHYKNGKRAEDVNANWMDIKFVEDKKKETFRHSDTRQPLHTDGAYTSYQSDISFFYCEEYAPVGGATTFIDGVDLINLLSTYEPDLLKELENTEVIFDKGDHQRKVSKIVRYDEKGPLFNFNHFRVSKKNSKEVIDMCDRFHWFLDNKIAMGGLLTPVYLKTGEAVWFQDDRVMHGRNAFFGNRCLIKGGLNL